MSEIIAGIDVGTTKICALIAEIEGDGDVGEIRLLGAGIGSSQGMEAGMVTSVPRASEAIAQTLEEAELSAQWPIRSAYVGISGQHISTITSRATISVSRSPRGITLQDVSRVLAEARTGASVPPNMEIIHVLPLRFAVDDQTGIQDPVGMQSERLEVEVLIVLGASSAVANLVRCIEDYGVRVQGLVLEPLAAGEAVLTPAERELGVIVVDIGGGTTDIAVFIDRNLWHTVVRNVGGALFTKDLAYMLRTPLETAEELKILYGHVLPERISGDEAVSLSGFGSAKGSMVPRRLLASILAARADETMELILTELKRSGCDGVLPAGMVLCGGTAQLPGLVQLCQNALQSPVRIGTPNGVRGLSRELTGPAFASSVGLLRWGLRHGWHSESTGRNGDSSWSRVSRWLANLLPG